MLRGFVKIPDFVLITELRLILLIRIFNDALVDVHEEMSTNSAQKCPCFALHN